jgi:arylformamidase
MKLYRDFTSQDELDREYNPSAAVPDSGRVTEGWARRSAVAREELSCELGVRYGPTREEYLDIFPAGPGAPLHLFIHGGYWRRFSAREFSFVARPLVAAGITTLVVNYALCPAVTIDEIVRQTRAAVAWAWANSRHFGGDRDRITVSGHSAGGHLVAMALSTDWPGAYDLPADILKGGVAISGLFDLAPFPYTYLQPALQLTWGQVRRNSPIELVPDRAPPLLVAVGGAESAEFRRQSADYLTAWRAHGLSGTLLEAPAKDHFTVLDELETPETALFATLRKLAHNGTPASAGSQRS